jgi:molybdate transport system substrate-binding protein
LLPDVTRRSLATASVAVAVALVALPALADAGGARTVSVAAAANLKFAIEALARGFESERPGARVAPTFGASGSLFAQAQNGAPFDVFFSADTGYPRKLVEAGLARPEDEVVYATGKLVVWAPKDSTLELEEKGLSALAGPAVGKLAMANPAVAPYGRAAEAALRSAGVLEAVRGRLVLGQNVSQAAQFAQSGAADAALVPLSLTFAPELADGKVYPVPQASYPVQEQSALVLAAAKEPELARAFVKYVTGPRGRELLARYGYGLP